MSATPWVSRNLVSHSSIVQRKSVQKHSLIPLITAIGDTLVAPLNGVEWCSDKLIDLGDDHQMKVYEETRNTTYGDLSAYTAWVYYLPGYILWPIGALAPSELYPMTKSCMAVLNDENSTTKKEETANARYKERKKLDELYRGEEESFQEW